MAYLLVAEVDKIQSFILESAKLRQVVGASAMLEKFGADVRENPKKYLGEHTRQEHIIASAGGSFRVRFEVDDEAIVIKSGNQLKKAFEDDIGGSITIAPPVEWHTVDWKNDPDIIEIGNDALRTAKTSGRAPVPLWHMPYMAQCQSSGVELAFKYSRETGFDDDTGKKYLGRLTLQKGKFIRENRAKGKEKFKTILDKLANAMGTDVHDNATDAETYAWDDRNYVAYLMADGNQMGKIFNACTPRQVTALSENLERLTREALAEAADKLPGIGMKNELPVLPLIMGGDDVFALMPANWAFDIARRYCDLYEQKVTKFLEDEGIAQRIGGDYKATLGAAIVICKASYPYKVAHEYGESLLSSVKNKGKEDPENPVSMLGIDWIVGSQVTVETEIPAFTAQGADALIHYRYQLRNMPSRVRERLRRAIENQDNRDFEEAFARYRELYPENEQKLLEAEKFLGIQGIYELVNMWDFLLDSTKPQIEYTQEGVR